MITPCENVFKYFLPALKVSTAKRLSGKGMNQMAIAQAMGLSQVAVSKYLSGKYSDKVKLFENSKEISELSEKTAAMIIDSDTEDDQVVDSVCDSCIEINGPGGVCGIRDFTKSGKIDIEGILRHEVRA